MKLDTIHDLGRSLGLDHLCIPGLVLESENGLVPGSGLGLVPSWVCPVLTSGPSCLVGEAWEPGTGEKGLRGLVRLIELKGLAGLLVLKEPDAPLATVQENDKEEGVESGRERAVRIHETLASHLFK